VRNEHGTAWDDTRQLREQAGWDEHAAFMDGLVAVGFVVLGGPVGDGSSALLLVEADGEEEIERRLAADPWGPMGLLRTGRIDRWEILLDRSWPE
jgi:hypothetical protein